MFTISNDTFDKQRRTQKQKNANDKQWYKDQINQLDSHSFGPTLAFNGVSEYARKKVNFDLFNNIIDLKDFSYVCQPYGAEVGELPANMTNRDIVSGKIKVLLGMEMKMPFSWKIIAVNEEATTRKEQKETELIKDFVISQIMTPIRIQTEREIMEAQKGRELGPEELQQLQAEIATQTQARTPDEVRKYMTREHQDPVEVLNQQLLQYLIYKESIPDKFNKGWKYSNLSAEEVYLVTIINGEPALKVANTLFFDNDKSPDTDNIEDGEWAVYEMRMSPSEIVSEFGSQLTEEQIDKIYDRAHNSPTHVSDADFTFRDDMGDGSYNLRVLHANWKSLKKIGFLTYIDQNGELQKDIVDENYKLSEQSGDVEVEWEWIPEAHEGYKIMDDIFVYCRPVPGQHRDPDNLYNCKLSYYGRTVDSLNSVPTSPMDRIKAYQYYYNIILYRIEMLMASDKGKIIAANIGAIPASAGIDIKKFSYFMEANHMAWFNPGEEGNKDVPREISNIATVLDMSLVSDISKYIEIAEYIEAKTGSAIGITPQMEAQIQAGEAVSNTRQNLMQASHIIQPYFETHNIVKANVLQGLLNTARVAYSQGSPRKLTYILDDMSSHIVDLSQENQELLSNSTVGLFVANSSKAHDAQQLAINLSQAAMQNQQADLEDIIKVARAESIQEAEEMLTTARTRKSEELQAIEKQKVESAERARQSELAFERERMKHEKEMIILKERERRETEIAKQTILSLGFNEDKDIDKDGTPDVLEVANHALDRQNSAAKISIENRKLEHQITQDREKNRLAEEKLIIDRKKANKPTSK